MISSLSISSVQAYNDCGKKWSFRYVHRLQEKPVLVFKIGTTLHKLVEGINTYIKREKKVPDKQEIRDGVEALVKSYIPEELFLTKKRTKKEQELSDAEYVEQERSEIIEQLSGLCDRYIDKADELFEEVLLIEKEHIIDIVGVPFKCIIDAVVRFKDGTVKIIDYKTRSKTSDDVAILQLISYKLAVEDLLKIPVDGLEQWDFIKKKDPEIRTHSIEKKKMPILQEVLLQEVEAAWKGISHKLYPRNLRSSFCGEAKCEFWDVCMGNVSLEKEREETANFHDKEVSNLTMRRKI